MSAGRRWLRATSSETWALVLADTTSPALVNPTPSFTDTVSGVTVHFDASQSFSTNGAIAAYSWDFGDGSHATTKAVDHTYANGNASYPVTLSVTDITGRSATISKVVATGAPVANATPTAAFSAVASDLTVALDGSASTDPDGSVVSWRWSFGDGSTAVTTSVPTTSHTYAAAGTFSISLTVTDNGGLTASTAKTLAFIAPGGGGDTGINQTGVAGRQQTGTNVVPIAAATGAAFSAAGVGKIASLPAGTFNTSCFAENGGGSAYGTGAAIGTAIGGIFGAGSQSTTIGMAPGTVPSVAGDTTFHISQGVADQFATQIPGSYYIDGILLKGPLSSTNYGGFYIYGAGRNGEFKLSNSTIMTGKGSSGGPPGETTQFNLQRAGGPYPVTVENVTVDGQNQAAAGIETNYFGMNTGGGHFIMRNVLFKNTWYSGGFCMHGNVNGSTVDLYNTVFQACHRNLGMEANGGNINIYDPIWSDKSFGNIPGQLGHDFNLTWTVNNYEGMVSIYFTDQAAYQRFTAVRNNPKFLVVDNFQAYNDATGASGTKYGGTKRIQDYFRVYIAGQLVGTGNSAYASGFAH